MKARTVWIVGGVLGVLLVVVIVLLVVLLTQMNAQAEHDAYLACLERLGYPADRLTEDIDGLAAAASSCLPD